MGSQVYLALQLGGALSAERGMQLPSLCLLCGQVVQAALGLRLACCSTVPEGLCLLPICAVQHLLCLHKPELLPADAFIVLWSMRQTLHLNAWQWQEGPIYRT